MITKDMSIGEVVPRYPETIAVFLQHGLGCLGCAVAHFENSSKVPEHTGLILTH